jgi:hypothetical protein
MFFALEGGSGLRFGGRVSEFIFLCSWSGDQL